MPLHITMRAQAGLPSFRSQILYPSFEQSVRLTRREDFRIIEFSIQKNHIHLIVEAESNEALARGMKSFAVRTNRRFNSALGRRRGRLWGDRYHREDLTTPRQVRSALVYCLSNFRKHEPLATPGARTIDPCSSARWFTGWNAKRAAVDHDGRPTRYATTHLLTTLWHTRHGLIDPRESPKPRSSR